MKPLTTAFSFWLAASLACTVALGEDSKISKLLDRAPSTANAIGYVNVDSLQQLMTDAGFSKAVLESVEEYWFIADLDLMKLRPKWEAGYASVTGKFDASAFAAQQGGYVDRIDRTDVVWVPQQTYVVPVEPNRLGVLRPADRALLSSWLNPALTVNFSEFLRSNATQPESYLSLMLAVDLQNVFSPVPLAKRLEGLQALKAQPAETVARTLSRVTGLSVIVGRRSLNECIVKFEFSQSPSSLKPIAAELLSEILDRNGTAAPEVATWDVKVEGNALALQGPITESTLDGLIGIFSLQSQANHAAISLAGAAGSSPNEQQQVSYRTKHYFDQVNDIVERTRSHKSQTTGALAKWNDQRARQIDELGTLQVDPEMVQYGANVSNLLRGNALTVRQGNIDAGKIQASQTLSSGYYGDGYYDPNSTADYQRVTSAFARGNAYANYQQVLNQIDQLTATMRRSMTDKYQMQF